MTSHFFAILLALAGVAILGVLFMGLLAMARGGEFNKKYGNKMMRWRVFLQAFAIGAFLLALVSR